MKTVKLVSGGIDSYIMAETYEGLNVYIDFGQKYAKNEKKALRDLGINFEEININCNFKDNDIYIPDRNLMMATLVTTVYNPDVIMMAGLKDDRCIDKNEEAFERMSSVISRYTNHPVKVISPFFELTKGEIIYRFQKKENLAKTFSCYSPKEDGSHCGNCPACLRKAISMETNGISCGYQVSEDIIKQYLQKIHKYDPDRISRFFIFIKKRKPVYAIDIDGVLCEDDETYNYASKKPKKASINRLKSLDGYIVLYTARLETDREETEKWLSNNNVKYDSLIMSKLPYSELFDDKTKEELQ